MGRRRTVRERDPKVIRSANSILGLIWIWAITDFIAKGGVDLFHMRLNAQANYIPIFIGLALTLLVFFVVYLILRIQNAAGKSLCDLQSLSPDVFEEWVAARFRDLGYSVKVAGGWGDHGVDLVGEKGDTTVIVQCKNHRAWKVGEPVLRDLYGAMHDFGADKAYLVTTGRVTQAARTWVKGKPIEIWDGEMVTRLSRQFAVERRHKQGELPPRDAVEGKTVLAGAAANLGETPAIQAVAKSSPAPTDRTSPTCPKCGSTLVQRRNRATGEPFLACPGYPECRYTRPMPV